MMRTTSTTGFVRFAWVVLIALTACGPEPADSASAPPPPPIGEPASGPEQSSDSSSEPDAANPTDNAAPSPAPIVMAPEDATALSYPVRIVRADGSETEVADAAQLAELLAQPSEDDVEPEVEYVRLFYATDRARITASWRTILGPLLPAFVLLLIAWFVVKLLKRWLRDEVRRIAYVAGSVVTLAAVGAAVRGGLLSLETLRLSRETDVLYGSRRNQSGALEYGTLLVSIPAQRHEVARIEMPSILKGEVFPDPLRHFVIDDVHAHHEDEYFRRLRSSIEASPGGEACVFVHGYNNTFAYAAMRLAQIVYDVGFEGTPILYSWPSKGSAALYMHDRENAEWSEGNLAAFLDDLRTRSGASRIHLLAHSMGSRILSDAVLQAVPLTSEGDEPLFSELILAAPDIDADTFRRHIAPRLMQRTARVTLYASDRDEALIASVQVNGHRRAGMAGDGLVILDGMDTIDVSHVAGGHAYIADNGRVLFDLVDVVNHHRTAAERDWLKERERDGARYWEMVRR